MLNKSKLLPHTKKKLRKAGISSTAANRRFYILIFCLLVIFSALTARILYIQIVEPDNLIKEGDLRSIRVKALNSSRGIISDRNDEPLAVSVMVEAVWADPYTIFKENSLRNIEVWYALADVLKLDRTELINKVIANKGKRFIYIQRQVSSTIANYIRSLKIIGIGLQEEERRYYPAAEVSAHIIGVTGIDGFGLEGLERSYNSWLLGEAGEKTFRKDRIGRVIEDISLEDKQEGKPLRLTIDQRIQSIAYRAIKQAVADHRATSGSAVLLDVKTGEVLAMVNAPSYNPNNRSDWQNYKMRNRIITDSMEPGSTIKPFVILAALEQQIVDKDSIIDTGNGILQIGGSRVSDVSNIGKATLTEILKKSSNIGVTKLAMQMKIEDLLELYSNFGFGQLSELNLIGEVTGIFPSRSYWSPIEQATISYGYGLSITPIQLATAYATLGNYGTYNAAHIIMGDKNRLNKAKQVASYTNVKLILDMLETATQEGGSAVRAGVLGYRVGAKTGTSRKALAGGYSDEYITYTAGVAPVSAPQLALVVVINEPQGDDYYGGTVASPVFSEIMKGALQILNIAPDEIQTTK